MSDLGEERDNREVSSGETQEPERLSDDRAAFEEKAQKDWEELSGSGAASQGNENPDEGEEEEGRLSPKKASVNRDGEKAAEKPENAGRAVQADEGKLSPEKEAAGMSGKENRKKARKKKSKLGRFLSALIPIAAITVIAVCLFLSLRDLRQYHEAAQGYEDLMDGVVSLPADDETETNTGTQTAEAESTEEAEEDHRGIPGVDYPDLQIDYEELASVNPDFVGVLYIPVLDLVYPVAHSHDNNEYLTTTFYGTHNVSGSIFMDRYSAADYQDGNTFILGHNMRNMSMFGSLKRFEADPDLCSEDPYIYIYNEDKIRKYRIYSYYEPSVNDKMYSADADYNDPDTYDAFVQSSLRNSHYRTDETFDFSTRPRIVTLSTCWATDHTNNLVVHAFITGEYDKD